MAATEHAPAERAPAEEIERQSRLFPDIPLLPQFLDAVPNVVVVLNQQRQIVYANLRLFELLEISSEDRDQVLGRRPGEVLKCAHANESEGGCGTTKFCSTCGAVNAILSAQRMQEDVQECRIVQEQSSDALDFRAWATPLKLGDELFTIYAVLDISHEKRREFLERIFFHDILNTAGGLKGSAELVQGASVQELDELHDIILRLSDELIDEINAQRVLAAAESQELAVHPVTVKTIELLQEVRDLYSRHEAAAGRQVNIDSEAWNGSLATDRTLLRRVIGNMTKNALEASKPGETITLGCEVVRDGISFLVHNPGFIPPDVQLQIFQRSFSTKGVGRGLGTYSIKLLTERYLQGNVSFSTSPDEGTTFMARCRPMDALEEEEGTAAAGAAESRPSLRILLAEDNPVNQKLAVALLERAGHSVSVAGNGRDAVEALAEEAFDLVLMDVHMPVMDGLEATAAIREREEQTGTHVPVLALTASAMAGDQDRCLGAGMDGCLSKPIQVDELSAAVDRLGASPGVLETTAGATGEDHEPSFDYEEALAQTAGDRDLLAEIADLFLDNCPDFLAEVQAAVAGQDADALERSAHKLKGSVGNFCARMAFDAALKLEEIGRGGGLDGAEEALEALEREIDRFTAAIKAFAEGHGP